VDHDLLLAADTNADLLRIADRAPSAPATRAIARPVTHPVYMLSSGKSIECRNMTRESPMTKATIDPKLKVMAQRPQPLDPKRPQSSPQMK
jgi:hypothetical protein